MTLSCDNEEQEEALDVYVVRVGDLKQSPDDELMLNFDVADTEGADAVEPIFIKRVVVNAPLESPAAANVVVNLPEVGKYRLKLELASDYNKGVNIHSLALKHSTEAVLNL